MSVFPLVNSEVAIVVTSKQLHTGMTVGKGIMLLIEELCLDAEIFELGALVAEVL